MRRQVERRAQQLTNATAQLIIYQAFITDELVAPKHLARRVTSAVEAPQACRPGFWFMTTPAASTSEGRLFHTVLRLAGRPDYLIERPEGLVPVELKSGACPRSGPHAAHVAQLMTYCVLVEAVRARPVPYGVLQYSDARRQIPFTPDRKREVLQLADEIRRKRGSANVHRQHQHIGRCRKCGYRSVCEDALS